MQGQAKEAPERFSDEWVIYPSELETGRYVAHSLRTDQVGVGKCVLDAYIELARCIRSVLREATRDKRIQVYQPAPQEVWEKLRHAVHLPKEIEEIAAMKLAGRRSSIELHLPESRHPVRGYPPVELATV